ncbi:MAG: tRNA (adenosine(37)-N6)-dimethylallyltransferase MiaA [Flavobacteriaceae bacterium]|nr:tRNA (adenosine(37)-N6)-dimethylallyltransferase MiaA [Flavobacteriaceae bacterium]
MNSRKPLLICIVGPTAIGKTSLAIQLAKHFKTEIISADSRQFFKEMRIGTAVPSEIELSQAPHHFIQNKSIFELYSVGDFEREATLLLSELFRKHSIVIMVGGSGLYVDAVVKGLDNFPAVNEDVRKELNTQFEKEGIASLQRELLQVDPEYHSKVDLQNHHRLIRALEIYRSTGKPFSSFFNENKKERIFDTLYIGLTADRETVYERINQRVDLMMEEGLLEEAKKLLPNKSLNALQTVGYKELFQYLEGDLTLEEAISEIKKNTRRFAKRQGTWFKKNQDIHWFDFTTDISEIKKLIETKNAQ